MQRLVPRFPVLYVLHIASRRSAQTFPGNDALASFPGASGETQARALEAKSQIVFKDHDPWD